MLSKEELQIKAVKMNAYLQEKPGSEPNEIIDRIENLSVLISQAGEYLADSKYLQDSVIRSEIMDSLKSGFMDKLSMSAINKLVSALAKEENYLVNVFDRINSSGVHQMDSLRSVLSYRKAEFSTLSYGK